jgi:5'-deoxynucleotidase YfbR-like HD superfamily hydrolase
VPPDHTRLQRVDYMRRGLATKRFHTVPTIGEHTVGQHSAGVALLIVLMHPGPSRQLLSAALTHDLSEWRLGDIPAQVKWNHSAIASAWEALETELDHEWGLEWDLTVEERNWLKACDTLELMLFAREQLYLGNTYYRVVWDRGVARMATSIAFPVELSNLIADVIRSFQEEFGNDKTQTPGLPA